MLSLFTRVPILLKVLNTAGKMNTLLSDISHTNYEEWICGDDANFGLPELDFDRYTISNDALRAVGALLSKPSDDNMDSTTSQVSTDSGSAVNSECSNDIFADIDIEVDAMLPKSDELPETNEFAVYLGNYPEDDKSEEFGWSDGSEETSSLPGDFVSVLRGDSVRKTQSEPPSPSPRKCRKTSQSNCTHHEDHETLRRLENIVNSASEKLDVRSQLEMARIIRGTADAPLNMRDVISWKDDINDVIIEKLERYLRKHSVDSLFSKSNCVCCPDRSTSYKPTKRTRRSRQRTAQSLENNERKRKEAKQTRKEKRSGLFRREEVVTLESLDPGDTELDVDVC